MSFGISLFTDTGVLRLEETTRLMRVLGVITVTVPSGSGLYLVGIGNIVGTEWTCTGLTSNVSTSTLYSVSSAFKYDATTVGFLRAPSSTLVHTVYIIGF